VNKDDPDKVVAVSDEVNSDKVVADPNEVNTDKIVADPNEVNTDKVVADPNEVNTDTEVNTDKIVADPNEVNTDKVVADPNEVNTDKVVEPTEEEVVKQEVTELEDSLRDVIETFPAVKEIIDENPIVGHAITLLQNVFPNRAKWLTTFLSNKENQDAINGIISEMKQQTQSSPEQFFSQKINAQIKAQITDLSDDEMSNLEKITPKAIKEQSENIKKKAKDDLIQQKNLTKKEDFPPGTEIITDKNSGQVLVCAKTGGKRKSKTNKTKKSKKSKKIKKSKSAKRRTHKKKSKK
jgi:hypothetical protein